MVDLNALKTELTTDPQSLGYIGNDIQDANIINDQTLKNVPRIISVATVLDFLSQQTNGSGASKRWTLDMLREYAISGTVRGSSVGETDPESRQSAAQMIWQMLNLGENANFKVDVGEVRNAFIAIGPNGPGVLTSAQLSSLANLAKRTGSRAEELFGQSITTSQIADARRL